MARYDKSNYTFRINGCSPETLPMAHLARYLAEISNVLEGVNNVHFESITPGSARLNFSVAGESKSVAKTRLASVTSDPKGAKRNIGRLLKAHGYSSAKLYHGKMPMWTIAGKVADKGQIVSMKNEALQGLLFDLGGKQDTVRAFLQASDGKEYRCKVDREIAEEMKSHLWHQIQVIGDAEWLKEPVKNEWVLSSFVISEFKPLKRASIRETFQALSSLPSGWGDVADPHADLLDTRP